MIESFCRNFSVLCLDLHQQNSKIKSNIVYPFGLHHRFIASSIGCCHKTIISKKSGMFNTALYLFL